MLCCIKTAFIRLVKEQLNLPRIWDLQNKDPIFTKGRSTNIYNQNSAQLINYFQKLCSNAEVFLGKGVLKIFSNFTREYPCRSVISIKLLSNFIEITLQHGCSSANLLHIFRTTLPKNTFSPYIYYRESEREKEREREREREREKKRELD